MMRLMTVSVLLLSLIAVASATGSDVVLVLDASGSMWGQVEGKNKITIARGALKDLMGKIPNDSKVGLVAYGHRRKGDCGDIEALVALTAHGRGQVAAAVDALNPKGMTPITATLQKVFDDVRSREDATTVILISDGLETCGGDPCQAVKTAKEAGINFVMHVVGFDVGNVNASSLECAAQAAGGLYFDARDADGLAQALDQAVAAPADEPKAKLSVKVVRNGKLHDAMVRVVPSAGGDEVAFGRTYVSDTTNPRVLAVEPGTYDLRVEALRIKGDSVQIAKGIKIDEGQTIEKVFEFGTGTLAVKVTRNGKLSDAGVNIVRFGERKRIAGGRTYTSANHNPFKADLSPGEYQVTVKALELAQAPSRTFTVEVKSGETVSREFDFSSGILGAGATRNGKLTDVTVNVTRSGERKSVAAGRTYRSPKSNPKKMVLSPGVYDVTLKSLEISGSPSQTFTAEVKAGESVSRTLEFDSGSLKVGVNRSGRLVDATVSVVRKETGKSVAGGRTYTKSTSNPRTYELSPGAYEIRLKEAGGEKARSTIEVVIKKGQTVERLVDLDKK